MPRVKDELSMRILNFVLESDPTVYGVSRRESVYKINVVVEGGATVYVDGNAANVVRGDVFITLPSSSTKIDGGEGFKFAYASFVGRKGTMIIDKLKITRKNFTFCGGENLLARWTDCFRFSGDALSLAIESAILYTAAVLSKESDSGENNRLSPVIQKSKKFADDNFYDCSLTLNSVAAALFYNPKYLSYKFKKEMNVGFNDYLKSVRVQHAITLFNSGINGVKEVALNCGFSDGQYFCKTFKQKTGYAPSEYKRKFLGES